MLDSEVMDYDEEPHDDPDRDDREEAIRSEAYHRGYQDGEARGHGRREVQALALIQDQMQRWWYRYRRHQATGMLPGSTMPEYGRWSPYWDRYYRACVDALEVQRKLVIAQMQGKFKDRLYVLDATGEMLDALIGPHDPAAPTMTPWDVHSVSVMKSWLAALRPDITDEAVIEELTRSMAASHENDVAWVKAVRAKQEAEHAENSAWAKAAIAKAEAKKADDGEKT